MPELIDGMTPSEFLAKVTLKRGRPNRELQEKLDRARALVDQERKAVIEKQTNPDIILKTVERNFEILKLAGEQMIAGNFTSLIVSGAAGIGKTYTLDMEVFGPAAEKGKIHYRKVSGTIKPVQLVKLLYDFRSPNSVLLLDDNDSVFAEEDSLNILKAALDSSAVRRVSWLSSTDELEEDMKDFMFEGRVAFITNVDMNAELQKDNRQTPHIRALRSRSHYLDLGLHNKHAQALWTARIVKRNNVVVKARKVTPKQQDAIVTYILANYDRMQDISIRAAINMGAYVHLVKDVENADNWREVAQAFGY